MVIPGDRYGSWALVAGAAEGLGEGFSGELARKGFNLVMVDRNAEALLHQATALEQRYGILTERLTLDLAESYAAERCLAAMKCHDCRLLVYVAAWSRVALFTSLPGNEVDASVSVNVSTPIRLIHGFSALRMTGKQTGGIILVSSLAGLIGPKYVAAYAATKSYLTRFAEAVHDELAVIGINILAVSAGTIRTPAYQASRPGQSFFVPSAMEPEAVASYALGKLGKTVTCIPGAGNRMQYFLLERLLPRSLSRRLVNGAMEKMYGAGL